MNIPSLPQHTRKFLEAAGKITPTVISFCFSQHSILANPLSLSPVLLVGSQFTPKHRNVVEWSNFILVATSLIRVSCAGTRFTYFGKAIDSAALGALGFAAIVAYGREMSFS